MNFSCWATGTWAAGTWVEGSWCPGEETPTPTPTPAAELVHGLEPLFKWDEFSIILHRKRREEREEIIIL